MSKKNSVALGLAVTVAVLLTGCGTATLSQAPPATVTKIAGSPVAQIRLTDQAIHRLGIVTQPVREVTGAGRRRPARTRSSRIRRSSTTPTARRGPT